MQITNKPRISFSVALLILLFVIVGVSGCADWKTSKGVENRWRKVDPSEFQVGRTTRGDVLEKLGPPSQVVSHGESTILYYMLEQQSGKGVFLILFNWARNNTIYDRAIFFFDSANILSDFSLSHEHAEMDE